MKKIICALFFMCMLLVGSALAVTTFTVNETQQLAGNTFGDRIVWCLDYDIYNDRIYGLANNYASPNQYFYYDIGTNQTINTSVSDVVGAGEWIYDCNYYGNRLYFISDGGASSTATVYYIDLTNNTMYNICNAPSGVDSEFLTYDYTRGSIYFNGVDVASLVRCDVTTGNTYAVGDVITGGSVNVLGVQYVPEKDRVYMGGTNSSGGFIAEYNPATNLTTNKWHDELRNATGRSATNSDFIISMAYDDDKDRLYFVGLDTSVEIFGYYDFNTNLAYDLAETDVGNFLDVEAVWYGLEEVRYDTNQERVYISGDYGAFAYFDPAVNITYNLNDTDPANWVGSAEYSFGLTIDRYSNVYIAFSNDGVNSLLGVYGQNVPVVDTTPPVITVVNPANNSVIEEQVTINISIDEAGTCILNESAFNLDFSYDTYFRFSESTLTDGNYNILATCNDTLNNLAYSFLNFTKSVCVYGCTNFTACQPDVTGGYNNCTEVNETGECVYGGDFTEFQQFCNYCTLTEEMVLGECDTDNNIRFNSYQLTNNETCCALTGNSTDCTVSDTYNESCGYSQQYGAGEMAEVGIDLITGIFVGIVGFVSIIALIILVISIRIQLKKR